jgi:hypothetical protein
MRIGLKIVEGGIPTVGRSADVVVVGSGLSAMYLAVSLKTKDPSREIIILEDGPKGPLTHLDSSLDESGFARWCGHAYDPFAVQFRSPEGTWRSTERHVVGGRGLYWGGVLCRIAVDELRNDQKSVEWLNRCGLAAADDGYRAVEERMDQLGFLLHGEGSALPTVDTGNRLTFRGITRAARLETSGVRVFAPTDFFGELQGHSASVTLVSGTRADSLLPLAGAWEVKSLTGSQESSIRAQTVVLGAGTRAIAEILARSLSSRAEVEFTLEDHLVAGSVVCIPEDDPIAKRLLEVVGEDILCCELASTLGFNLFWTISQQPGRVIIDVWGMGEKDRSALVELKIESLTGQHMRQTFKCQNSRDDLSKIETMLELSLETLASALCNRRELYIEETPSVTETTKVMREVHFGRPNYWKVRQYRSVPGSVDHDACLSSQLLTHKTFGWETGMDGVYMVGPASLVRMGSANPALTAMAIAYKLADHLSR